MELPVPVEEAVAVAVGLGVFEMVQVLEVVFEPSDVRVEDGEAVALVDKVPVFEPLADGESVDGPDGGAEKEAEPEDDLVGFGESEARGEKVDVCGARE